MKDMIYTWNLTVPTINQITLQHSTDGVTWINALVINNPSMISNQTVSVPIEATHFRITGINSQTLCTGILSNLLIL
jgi:hypothetical protein